MKKKPHSISESRLPRLFYGPLNAPPPKVQLVLDKLKEAACQSSNKLLVALPPSTSLENPWAPKEQSCKNKVVLQPIKSREQSVRTSTACTTTTQAPPAFQELTEGGNLLSGESQIQNLLIESRNLRMELMRDRQELAQLRSEAREKKQLARDLRGAAQVMQGWVKQWYQQIEGIEKLFEL